MRRYFGTDGIRGRAGVAPITAEFFLKLGQAVGQSLHVEGHRPLVLLGKDTRQSCYMLEAALASGLTSTGVDVMLTGPVPTPAVAYLVRSLRADCGLMISASHNPYTDNGVKFFDAMGEKLSDAQELEIEHALDAPTPTSHKHGYIRRATGGLERYIEIVKATLPRGLRFDGLKVCIDAAHGSGYQVLPQVLRELGAQVLVALGTSPAGDNINQGCGSQYPAALQQAVRDTGADAGIALDGDADRVILCDAAGDLIDGDGILAFLAQTLNVQHVVGTTMCNGALEAYLAQQGRTLHRAAVGDRYVRALMQQVGSTLGGEPSGHIILGDATTGDGLATALHVLSACVQQKIPLGAACRPYTPYPQLLRSYKMAHKPSADALSAATQAAQNAGAVRAIIRPSGTEPVLRIMTEAPEATVAEQAVLAAAQVLGLA